MLLDLHILRVLTAAWAVNNMAKTQSWEWKVILANPLRLCSLRPTRFLSLLKTRSTATLFLYALLNCFDLWVLNFLSTLRIPPTPIFWLLEYGITGTVPILTAASLKPCELTEDPPPAFWISLWMKPSRTSCKSAFSRSRLQKPQSWQLASPSSHPPRDEVCILSLWLWLLFKLLIQGHCSLFCCRGFDGCTL